MMDVISVDNVKVLTGKIEQIVMKMGVNNQLVTKCNQLKLKVAELHPFQLQTRLKPEFSVFSEETVNSLVFIYNGDDALYTVSVAASLSVLFNTISKKNAGRENAGRENAGKTCKVHYVGAFNDGSKFDSSYAGGSV